MTTLRRLGGAATIMTTLRRLGGGATIMTTLRRLGGAATIIRQTGSGATEGMTTLCQTGDGTTEIVTVIRRVDSGPPGAMRMTCPTGIKAAKSLWLLFLMMKISSSLMAMRVV